MTFPWLLILIVVMIAIIAAGMLVLSISMRSDSRRAARSAASAFGPVPDGNEYRSVIFKAYQRLEANLQRYGVIRLGNETVRQFLLRVPEHFPVDKKALRDFLEVFERARYSDHPCGEKERADAINALRAIQYSLEKVVLTQKQLEALVEMAQEGAAPIEPTPATVGAMGLWLSAPFVAGPVQVNADPAGKYRPLVPPRDKGKEELLGKLGPSNVTAATRLPKEEVERLSGLVAGKNYAGLGTRLLELAGGPAKGWRVRVEPSLVSYLLEFVARSEEAGRLRMKPGLDDSMVILLASTVLAVADGRDYLVPDDLKLALVSAGPLVYHAEMREIRMVLDEEIREVPMPWGPAFLRPEPVRVRGLTVPSI